MYQKLATGHAATGAIDATLAVVAAVRAQNAAQPDARVVVSSQDARARQISFVATRDVFEEVAAIYAAVAAVMERSASLNVPKTALNEDAGKELQRRMGLVPAKYVSKFACVAAIVSTAVRVAAESKNVQ